MQTPRRGLWQHNKPGSPPDDCVRFSQFRTESRTLSKSVILSVIAFATCLVAAVFYAFSGFVMRALEATPTAQGATAMVSMNTVICAGQLCAGVIDTRAVGGRRFCLVFVVCADGCDCLDGRPVAVCAIGVLGVTILRDVSLNNRLARASDPASFWSS